MFFQQTDCFLAPIVVDDSVSVLQLHQQHHSILTVMRREGGHTNLAGEYSTLRRYNLSDIHKIYCKDFNILRVDEKLDLEMT